MRVVVATGNAHKLRELRELLAGLGGTSALQPREVEVVGLRDFSQPAPAIAETEDTFEGNARCKADGIAAWLRAMGEPGDTFVLADDSGLCVDALGGRPGVWSALFAGAGASDDENNAKLVEELRALGLDRSLGHYVAVLILRRVDGRAFLEYPVDDEGVARAVWTGRFDVEIRVEARGAGGFGYDPHCFVDGGQVGVAELSPAEKHARSHRGRAMAQVVTALARWQATELADVST